MKTLSIISVVLTARLAAGTASPDSIELQRRQFTGLLGFGGYGKVSAGFGGQPTRTEMPSRFPNIPGSKTVKIRYGPYKIPSVNSVSITGESGMLWNYPDFVIEKPCSRCMIFGLNSGLETLDGKNANADRGLWLHHIVLLNSGTGTSDPTCKSSTVSLPHLVVGMLPQRSERFWASGNERTVAQFPTWGATNAGYKVNSSDRWGMIVDLMNMNVADMTAYVTMYYDYVEGFPAGWDEVKPIWFDISQCMFSEWPPSSQTGAFTVTANPWTADFNGEILGVAGHLHDGGTDIVIETDGKRACESVAGYGEKPEFVSSAAMPGMDGHSHAGMPHISSMTWCTRNNGKLNVRDLKKGQRWVLKANYDYRKFAGMTHGNGKQDNIMGIAIMFVRVKN